MLLNHLATRIGNENALGGVHYATTLEVVVTCRFSGSNNVYTVNGGNGAFGVQHELGTPSGIARRITPIVERSVGQVDYQIRATIHC